MQNVAFLDSYKRRPLRESVVGHPFLEGQKLADSVVSLSSEDFFLENSYYQMGLPGSLSEVFLREELVIRLKSLIASLPDGYGLLIYDGFRSMQTQKAIFEHVVRKISQEEKLEYQEAFKKTCTFFTNPYEVSFDKVPHNTGGAVDLTLTYNDKPLDMGTEFDATEETSYTDYFESQYKKGCGLEPQRWGNIRENRRLLYHSMLNQGFTNYCYEWWHYDFGNSFWSEKLKKPSLFSSCESIIL